MAFTIRTELTLGHNSYHQEKTLKRPANQPFNNRDMDCSIIDKQFKQRDKQFTNRDKSFNNWEKSFTIRDRLFKKRGKAFIISTQLCQKSCRNPTNNIQ